MPRHKKRKTDRVRVSEETLKGAVAAVVLDHIPIREVSQMYPVKKSTLSRFVQMNKHIQTADEIDIPNRKIPNKVFTSEQEVELEEYLVMASKMHHGLTTVEARKLAYQYANALKLKIPEKWPTSQQAGLDWLFGFMERHPGLSIRAPEATSLSRATSFNKTNVGKFYENLGAVLDRYQFSPNKIYNLDETGCTTVQKPPNVIAKKGSKQVGQITSSERGTLVTVCCFINASGGTIPPVFVFPKANIKPYMTEGAPVGSLALAYKTGWMTAENFFKLMHHFVQFTQATKENPVLLLLDNHESHISIETIQYAKNNGVVMVTFPPHCSHRLQPLDVGVYGPFKKRYSVALNDWMLSNPGKPVGLYHVPKLVNKAFVDSFTPKNILSAFSKTGIFPFNRENFDENDFLSSYVSDRPQQTEGANTANSSFNKSAELDSPTASTSAIQKELDVISPSFIRPFPKAPPRTSSNRGRKPGRTRILTDTPEKEELERLANERKKKAGSVKKKVLSEFKENKKPEDKENINRDINKQRKYKRNKSDSESEDEESSEELSLHDSSSENEFNEIKLKLKLTDFVLVKFSTKKQCRYYVGIVNEIANGFTEAKINFLRKKSEAFKFYYPEQIDESWIDIDDIEKILTPLQENIISERSVSVVSFSDDLSIYNVQ